MVNVYAYYEDGKDIELQHITKILYVANEKAVEVPEENLLTHPFPIGRALWLYSNDGISIINGNGLRLIDIKKE